MTRCSPKMSFAISPSWRGDIARGDGGAGDDHLVEHGLQGLEQLGGVLVLHHGHDADQAGEGERVLDGVAQGPPPRRGCGRRRRARWAAAHDLEATRGVDARQPGPQHVDVEGLLAPTEEGLDRRNRHGRVLRLVGAEQREEQVGVLAGEAAQRDQLPTDGHVARDHAELVALDTIRAPTSVAALDEHRDRLGRLPQPDDGDGAALMMPAFSRDLLDRVAEPVRWSSAIGVTTETGPSTTLVASHSPPMPTSTTATSTGASANAAYATVTSTSKKVSGASPRRSSWRRPARRTGSPRRRC